MENQSARSCDVASKGLRFANFILDAIFINVLASVIWFVIGFFIGFFSAAMGKADVVLPVFREVLLSLPGRLSIACVNVFVYFFLCEALFQRTLAKLITGTKVVAVNGTRPTFGAIALRTLGRLVPFEPFSFLTGSPGGWHDWWSGTIVVLTHAAQYRQPQPASYPVVDADFGLRHLGIPSQPAQDRQPQPLNYPAAVNANLEAPGTSIPSCEPLAQRMGAPEPACASVAASKTPGVQGRGRGGKTVWVVGGSIAVVLGAIMVWSANRPVKPVSASDTFGQAEPAYTPPAAPSVYVPPSAPSIPGPVPEPTPVSAPLELPPTVQVQAVVVSDGKVVVYSDAGVLTEGQTVSGWKVVRITEREIVLKKGDAVHTYPLSGQGAGSK